MKSKKIMLLLVGLLLLLGAIFAMGRYDYSAVAAGRKPLFAGREKYPADGGSVEFVGFGYSVTKMHRLSGNNLNNEVTTPGSTRFYVGQKLEFSIPLPGIESIHIVIETNR